MMTEDAREIMLAIDRLTSAVLHLSAVTAAGVLATQDGELPARIISELAHEVGGEL